MWTCSNCYEENPDVLESCFRCGARVDAPATNSPQVEPNWLRRVLIVALSAAIGFVAWGYSSKLPWRTDHVETDRGQGSEPGITSVRTAIESDPCGDDLHVRRSIQLIVTISADPLEVAKGRKQVESIQHEVCRCVLGEGRQLGLGDRIAADLAARAVRNSGGWWGRRLCDDVRTSLKLSRGYLY